MIKIKTGSNRAIFYAILAAALYGLNMPLSKILLRETAPMMMAAFLYIGAGIGMLLLGAIRSKVITGWKSDPKLTRQDLPYTIMMVLLDIAAPIFLMFGVTLTTAANASLLNNFEIVATAIIALMFFGEKISKRLWIAITLITLSSILLTVDDKSVFSFSIGSLLVLLACVCWGLENNCTRKISHKDPIQIVTIKGFGSGIGALCIALSVGEPLPALGSLPMVLLLGFVAYGLSIFFYTYAQRTIGAAKTSAYYAVAPFIGVGLSFLLVWEKPMPSFFIALAIMVLGTYLTVQESNSSKQ